MKKLFLLALAAILSISTFAQEPIDESTSESKFPYGKLLKMSPQELFDAKFKFDDYKNQYVLRKVNGWKIALTATAGTNPMPSVNDYQVIIQEGATGVAFIEVTFYDTKIYHDILTFAKDNGQDFLETNSSAVKKAQFNYDNYSFSLTCQIFSQSATAKSGRSSANTVDQSFDTYTFTIYTGIDPVSDFLAKQEQKAKKRDERGGKKRSAADLM